MHYSPLRYPGGKGKLTPLIELLIDMYGHRGGTYIEPFAGGAGVAIELLEKKVVSKIVINDLDKGIYSFWRAILEETDKFLEQVNTIPLTIAEWKKQRRICFEDNKKYSFELGFATFYMNRTNRSGIIKAGAIGGVEQSGLWKLDARFNREDLIFRIKKIVKNKSKIHLYNKDIKSFLEKYLPKYKENVFIYFDPPYFNKGKQLYLNFFDYNDHIRIKKLIDKTFNCDWVITYDDEPEIEKIYEKYCIKKIELNYSMAKKRKANELIIFKDVIEIPSLNDLKTKNIDFNLRETKK
ncbi:DNA adenine methylase [Fusobacterium nucleatum]|uniref:DNA adenine methylase n=1 Tax=Fusobacterium nucleatum TaxID=851 RepID=UPI003D01601F